MFGFKLSWKMIFIGLIALAIAVAIQQGYAYVQNLQNKTIQLAAEVAHKTGELNMARFERNIAETRAEHLQRAQEELADRLGRFNQAQAEAQSEIERLRHELQTLDLEKEITDDAQAARARLNARARDLNRLLERRSQP